MSFLQNDSFFARERFSLLLLDPGELYFEDFSADHHLDISDGNSCYKDNEPKRGKLKICSKSVVFDPQDVQCPIIKFPMKSITDISKETPLKSSKEYIVIKTNQFVSMKEKNIIKPYVFSKGSSVHKFSFNFISVDDCLPLMCQLHRASSLPLLDQNLMVNAIIKGRQMRIKFDTSWLEDLCEKILMEVQADHVDPLVINPGRLLLTGSRLYFQPFNNIERVPVMKLKFSNITSIAKRRFLLRHVGLEIFISVHGAKKQLYLSFSSRELRDAVYDTIHSGTGSSIESHDLGDAMLKWQNGLLSNYDYLLLLNSLADRSFNDLTQYPIMPWIISDYSSEHIDLTLDSTFRDLSKPIGALNSDRLEALKKRSEEMPEPKFLYGSHYSTPAYVLFYLSRIAPEYVLCLQNGKFDQPDRMFNSISDTWDNCLTSHSDFKELIPEFFNTDSVSFLYHTQPINFGQRSNRKPVGDVELPPWAQDGKDFLRLMAEALESDYVSSNLHNWIDLIFGCKQTGDEAAKADNVFYYLTYEGNLNLDNIKDSNERACLEVQIMEFGQIPTQVFTKPHPQRFSSIPLKLSELTPPNIVEDVLLYCENDENTFKISSLSSQTIKSLRPHHKYNFHKAAVFGLVISDNCKQIYSVSQDGLLKVYSLEDQCQSRSVNFSSMALSSVAALSDASTVVVSSWDNYVYVYSIEYGRTLYTLPAHDDAVTCIYCNGSRLITGSWDATVKVWELVYPGKNQMTVRLQTELDHESKVLCLDYDPGHSVLAVGLDVGSVQVWDMTMFSPLENYSAHEGPVTGLIIRKDNRQILSCGSDKILRVWDHVAGTDVFSRNLGYSSLCLALSGDCLCIGTTSGEILIVDVLSAQVYHSLMYHSSPVTTLCVFDNSLLSGSEDGSVVLWMNS